MSFFEMIRKQVNLSVIDDNERKQKQLFFIELILSLICLIMSIVNIITHQIPLLISTSTMSLLSFANAYLIYKLKNHRLPYILIFTFKCTILFTYFIITGGTEGFSVIWLLIIPSCAPFAFGKKNGTILSIFYLIELLVFFYTPLYENVVIYSYTFAFRTRFPILYTSFMFLGIFLEHVRERTQNALSKLKKILEFQSSHDQLTSLNNRIGFKTEIDNYLKTKPDKYGLLIIDIDFFKDVNDNYGHIVGDSVLKEISKRISKFYQSNLICCRWGGEEFAVFVKDFDSESLFKIAEEIRIEVSRPIVLDNVDLYVTISIGCVSSNELTNFTFLKMIDKADERLYKAKNTGRNKTVIS